MFATYCALSEVHHDSVDITDFHIGGGADLGIDGIAIILNGTPINSVEEVQGQMDSSGHVDVMFMFVQAKSSSSFSGESIANFLDGVDEFFSENPRLPMNDRVVSLRLIMEEVYANSSKFKKSKPVCRVCYATTGRWTDDPYLIAKVEKSVDVLRSTNLFSDVQFVPMGADELQEAYQRSKNSVTAEFAFANKVLLPPIDGVDEAYFGWISATEYLKIIEDGVGGVRKSLFTDNVRDFQSYNPVNTEIYSTIESKNDRGRFVVLNNGITIVARSLSTTRDKVIISDYQIVNGCQTSHVLFEAKEYVDETVHVPVKVIATQNEDVVNRIVTATNRQTQVTTDDLHARLGFAKKLESYFVAHDDKERLYLERRSRQYAAVQGIEKVRIVTKPQLIKAFAGMFLNEPHRALGYSGELDPWVGSKIFNDLHKLEPYYTAAYAHYKLEFFFRNGAIDSVYKPARFHLLMIVRSQVAGPAIPDLTTRKAEKYSQTICESLWDGAKALKAFSDATQVVDKVVQIEDLSRDYAKARPFLDDINAQLGTVPLRGGSA
ncbi:AIPR family protein [Nocardia bhagyanarayanae]|nr:AIPR family protein [Nocardia bhagyanarayanae]